MAWTHKIENARRDPSNFNIVVDIVFIDDSVPPNRLVDNNGGQGWPLGIVPAEDVAATLDEQARKRIRNVLGPGDLTLAAATALCDDKARTLPPDPDTSLQQAVNEASLALQKALHAKQLSALKSDSNAAVAAAAADLEAAQDAIGG